MLALAVFHNTAVVAAAAAAAVVAAVVAGHMQQIESSAPQYIHHYMHLHIAELICKKESYEDIRQFSSWGMLRLAWGNYEWIPGNRRPP